MSLLTNLSLTPCFRQHPHPISLYIQQVTDESHNCDLLQIFDFCINTLAVPVLSTFFGPIGTLSSIATGEALHTTNLMVCHNQSLNEAFFTNSFERSLSLAIKVGALSLSFLPATTQTAKQIAQASDLLDDQVMVDPNFGVKAFNDLKELDSLTSTKEMVTIFESSKNTFTFLGRIVASVASSFSYFFQVRAEIEKRELNQMNHLIKQTSIMSVDDIQKYVSKFKLFHIDSKTVCNPFLNAVYDLKFIEALQKMKAYPNPYDLDGKTPIHLAVIYRKPESLKLLLSNPEAQVDLRDHDYKTPLYYAVSLEDLNSMKLLVNAGASVDEEKGEQSFIHKAFFKKSFEMLEILSQGKNFDINAKGENGATVLFNAVASEKDDWVQALLALGANPDIQNYDGLSPRELTKMKEKDYFER